MNRQRNKAGAHGECLGDEDQGGEPDSKLGLEGVGAMKTRAEKHPERPETHKSCPICQFGAGDYDSPDPR